MSNVARVLGSAGNTQGIPANSDDLFKINVWDGSGSARTITNGINLSGEGGLTWIKKRSGSAQHTLQDTVRGATKHLRSSGDSGEATEAQTVTAFNSNGFSLGTDDMVNASSSRYVGWTFRQAPKFFDIVTYTGDGTSNRTISHNLGSTPGMIIGKSTSTSAHWMVWHTAMVDNEFLRLNQTDAQGGYGSYYEAGMTSTTVGVSSTSSTYGMNINGATYVLYIFAHNNSDGVFGSTGDQDIIKCGSYTGDGSTNGTKIIDLGFEPQWVLIKTSSTSDSWLILDNMRGIAESQNAVIRADSAQGDENDSTAMGTLLSNGFRVTKNNNEINGNGQTYVYMAIRRGPMATPDDATQVFATVNQAGGYQTTRYATAGFPVDFALGKETSASGSWYAYDRLRGAKIDLNTNDTSADNSNSPGPCQFDFDDKVRVQLFNSSKTVSWWMWKRAPGYFDMVAYTGTGSATTISHNLGVPPEMIWVKRRDTTSTFGWIFGTSANTFEADGYERGAFLNATNAFGGAGQFTPVGSHSATVFPVSTNSDVNASGGKYIAYLFATVAGVSKVGSFTSTGSDMTIDCGFTSGARFVLLKKTSGSDQWYLWDSVRGIVSGNDSRLKLNDTTAAVTHSDNIDPDNSGFILHDNILGGSGNKFIFYAIA